MSINAQEIRKQALQMYIQRDKYAYFYGAKGQVLTDAVMEALWQAEPAYFSKYTAAQKTQIFNYSRGKRGYDCSGFVCQVLRNAGSSHAFIYSTALYEECVNKSDLAAVKCGGYLYGTTKNGGRHAFLDIGNGFYLSMGKELSSIDLGKTRDDFGSSVWTIRGGEFPGFDYSHCTND